MNQLTIAEVVIRADEEGRFSLNDLHRAAGGEDRHQPAFFCRRPETQELIAEISNSAPVQNCEPVFSAAGRYGGTFASKEIVYSYAMWVSPKFHLQVIRTFDAVATGAQLPTVSKPARAVAAKPPLMVAAGMAPTVMRALRSFGIDKNAAAIGANQIITAQTGVNLLALAGRQHLPTPDQEICFTPTELGHRRCISAKTFNRSLADAGLQERIGEHWVPTAKGRPHAVVLDTGKAHGNGTPIQQVKWKDSVLAEVAL